MNWEMLAITVIIVFYVLYTGKVDKKKFVEDNKKYFDVLKEEDYEFLVKAKYGDKVDPQKLFIQRLKNASLVFIIMLFIFLTSISFINVLFTFVATFYIYKSTYNNLKSYYKKHLHDIDLLLPYYLKSLEILIQHYTVPVAVSKSIETSPAIFKEGLLELISQINAGNSTIDPYMDFAKKYPVRDSMRMMRLLYRLGLGNQDRKQDQLLVFSKTISTLQAKSRETKYKERLEKMEGKTMMMLTVTGLGVMLILLLAIVQMFGAS
jgi:multisubunit Na+/H+ antiporter MnhB subunit